MLFLDLGCMDMNVNLNFEFGEEKLFPLFIASANGLYFHTNNDLQFDSDEAHFEEFWYPTYEERRLG